MLVTLFALSTLAPLASPGGDPGAARLSPCAPDRHTACSRSEGPLASRQADVRPGKRCHPDPSRSAGCREVIASRDARKDAALATAR